MLSFMFLVLQIRTKASPEAYFYTVPNILKFKYLLCSENIAISKKLSEYVKVIISKFTF